MSCPVKDVARSLTRCRITDPSRQRITITIDDSLLEQIDEAMRRHGYSSRSEALRDILRTHQAHDALTRHDAMCTGTLSLVFDQGVRELPQRIARAHHEHHSLIISASRTYLDHHSCLEVIVMRGQAAQLQQFASSLASQRGVRNTNLHLVPVTVHVDQHEHGALSRPHEHLHA